MMTPTPVVVDVSVAVKWLFGEPGSKAAIAWKKQSLEGGAVLCAPEYLLVELHNVIWKKISFGELPETDPIVQYSPNFGLDLNWLPTLPLLPTALKHAISLKITIYDALYVALAVALDATFCTADAALVRKLKSSSIRTVLI